MKGLVLNGGRFTGIVTFTDIATKFPDTMNALKSSRNLPPLPLSLKDSPLLIKTATAFRYGI